MCINNMLAKAEELGCEPGNIECLCTEVDFGNGVRDCTVEACGPDALADIASQNICGERKLAIRVLAGTMLTVHPRHSSG
jgi:hypothetical protein